MATTKGPLNSGKAKGTIGDAITFTSWRGRPVVRVNGPRKNPKTPMQRGMRKLTGFISKNWKTLSQNEQQTWTGLAKKTGITELNAQQSDSQLRAKLGKAWRETFFGGFFFSPQPAANLVALPGWKEINLTFTINPFGVPDYCIAIYIDTKDSITGTISQIGEIIPSSERSVTITELKNDVPIFIRIKTINSGGVFSALSPEIEVTPNG